MIGRVLLALLGASVITGALLLGMDSVTSLFRERDTGRYFRITDILPRQAPERPTRPEPVLSGPDLPDAEPTAPDTRIRLEAPAEPEPVVPSRLIAPELERPTTESAED